MSFSCPYSGSCRSGSWSASCIVAFIDCQLFHGDFSSFITTLPLTWLSKQPCPRDGSASARFESPAHTQRGIQRNLPGLADHEDRLLGEGAGVIKPGQQLLDRQGEAPLSQEYRRERIASLEMSSSGIGSGSVSAPATNRYKTSARRPPGEGSGAPVRADSPGRSACKRRNSGHAVALRRGSISIVGSRIGPPHTAGAAERAHGSISISAPSERSDWPLTLSKQRPGSRVNLARKKGNGWRREW
jgi:hypothetical protein